MKQEMKVNSYLRGVKIIAIACVIGSVIGGGTGMLRFVLLSRGIILNSAWALQQIRSMLIPILGVIFAVTVLLEEICMRKLKGICVCQPAADDEECDRLEYEEEKEGAFGMNISVVSQVLSILVLTFGYSMKYITSDGHAFRFLAACIVFIACFIYEYFWQIRYVKLLQKIHPEKKGEPSSLKFQEQWLESCDEAEKEIIYRSAYKAYMTVNRTVPVLLVGTMVANLYFDTGMFAVVVVSVIWLLTQFTYSHYCIKLREARALVR